MGIKILLYYNINNFSLDEIYIRNNYYKSKEYLFLFCLSNKIFLEI